MNLGAGDADVLWAYAKALAHGDGQGSRHHGKGDEPAQIGPGFRPEVEQRLRADQRRLIAHAGNLDCGTGIEVVAIVVAPAPEVHQAGGGGGNQREEPRVEHPPPADGRRGKAERDEPGDDPRHVAELRDGIGELDRGAVPELVGRVDAERVEGRLLHGAGQGVRDRMADEDDALGHARTSWRSSKKPG